VCLLDSAWCFDNAADVGCCCCCCWCCCCCSGNCCCRGSYRLESQPNCFSTLISSSHAIPLCLWCTHYLCAYPWTGCLARPRPSTHSPPPAQINTPWKLHVTQIGNCTLGQKCDTQTSFNGDQGAVGIVWAAVLLTPCQAISSLVRKSTQLPDGFSHFPSQPLQSWALPAQDIALAV